MKRIAIHLLVAFLCFVGGLFAHELRTTSSSPLVSEVILIDHASVCDLVSDPTRYEGKIVSVKGILTGDRSGSVLSDQRTMLPARLASHPSNFRGP